jgi:hypothetical protein
MCGHCAFDFRRRKERVLTRIERSLHAGAGSPRTMDADYGSQCLYPVSSLGEARLAKLIARFGRTDTCRSRAGRDNTNGNDRLALDNTRTPELPKSEYLDRIKNKYRTFVRRLERVLRQAMC